MPFCSIRSKLHTDVQYALTDLVELVQQESEALKSDSHGAMRAIDELIERAFGRKERAIGALEQHVREHDCL